MDKKILTFIFLWCSFLGFSQFDIPEIPSKQTSVYDYADLLDESQEQQLRSKLIRYSDSTSTQIVIITIEDLKGEYIGQLAANWAQKWGIGTDKKDNGILMLMSKNDRKFWIAPGYEVEIKLTAGVSGTIYRNVIKPYFKQGDYYGGLDAGTDAVFQVLKGTFKNDQPKSNIQASKLLPVIIFIGVIVVLIIVSRRRGNGGGFGGGNSGVSGGFDLTDFIILSSLGRNSGGSSWGSSSGGSDGDWGDSGDFDGGFGGGDFSGGGAGGDW